MLRFVFLLKLFRLKKKKKGKIFAQRCSIGGVKFSQWSLDRITSAALPSNASELFPFLFYFVCAT